VEVTGSSVLPEKAGPESTEQLDSSFREPGAGLFRHSGTIVPEKPLSAPPLPAKRRSAGLPAVISIGVLLLAAAGAAFWWFSHRVSQMPSPLKLTRLTSDSGLTADAVISPDGKLVAYASDRSGKGNLDIWLKQVAGGDPIPLTRNSADDHQPDFSPDGSQIVFRSDREGGGIYLISTLGGTEERLVAPLGRNPRFSPHGGLIAYWTGHIQSRPLGAQASAAAGGLYVVRSTVGRPRKVETGFSAAGSPIWSPDGNYLLFYGHPTDLYPLSTATSDWWVVSKD
jgi:eukaryotic-like serine/threonine-protein kinase